MFITAHEDIPEGFDAEVQVHRLDLEAEAAGNTSVLVSAPDDAPAGTEVTVNVTASDGNGGEGFAAVTLTVAQVYAVELEMEGGASIVQSALDAFGRIDGVACVAGILRERMLFNMGEDEWDPVIATHLKGTFTVFRAASAVMRKQKSGTLIGFTSGAFTASVAQANYSAAKGGIISLTRSAAAGLHKYGVTANCIAPIAKSRMSGQVPSNSICVIVSLSYSPNQPLT